MEIVSCANLPSSIITDCKLTSLISLNDDVENMFFRLSLPEERSDNVEHPCLCFFENQSKPGLRIPPPHFLFALAKSYSKYLN